MSNTSIFDLAGIQAGSASGTNWLKGHTPFASFNPTDGSVLGHVEQTDAMGLNEVIHKAQDAFLVWRNVPAPKRGELIRLIGENLRKYKDALGTLV